MNVPLVLVCCFIFAVFVFLAFIVFTPTKEEEPKTIKRVVKFCVGFALLLALFLCMMPRGLQYKLFSTEGKCIEECNKDCSKYPH